MQRSWRWNWVFTGIEIEDDALSVVKRMMTLEKDFSPIGNVIEEAKRISALFLSISFKHVGRKENEVADCLAKHGLEPIATSDERKK